MAKRNTKRTSLSEIATMQKNGELHHDVNAPIGESLGEDFWDNATIIEPQSKTSVHLRLDSDIFDFFKNQGKGHLTRMNAVLRSYVEAHQPK
ncbi:MAG: BrnA antitoxin family protein [Rhizobiales bacterium]|nr:BrnA antitoxin family protein [Hyphomicrobiales bacterium]